MTRHDRGWRSRRPLALAACMIVVLVTACSSSAGPSPAVRTGEPPTERIPIIIDTDLELSDLAAIAVLLRDPAVDVRAITISGTGLVRCVTGRRVMRYVLDELGAFDVPYGCGREDGGPDAHPFPDAWRARADAAFGLEIPAQPGSDTPRDAVSVLRESVDDSPSAPTIVALGPLTNLEDALAADETLADRLAGVQSMLGTVDAPGNVFADGLDASDRLEWNAYADPSAVTAVFTSDVPLSLIPLDATRDVPVAADLADRLQSDHQAAGADLVYELLVRNPERLRPEDGQQLRDELAALALTDPDLVSWADASVTAGADGRFVRDEAGRTLRYAASADRPAVEAALLDALHRGEPRTTAFSLGGSIAVTFDGGRCAVTGTSDRPGVHQLTYAGPSGQPSGVMVVGIRPPHRWADVVALLPTYDARTAPPDWIVPGPSATDADGMGTPVTAIGTLDEDLAGVVCFTRESPTPAFAPGTSFAVGGGAIRGDAIRRDAVAPA